MDVNKKSEVTLDGTTSPQSKFKMPECWNDDSRMDYLFSHIRPPTANPLDKESKMKFWTSVIESWCLHYNQPSVTLSSLKKAFQRNGRTPECLPTVIENMHKDGDLVLHAEFVRIPPQQSWPAWTVDIFLKKPALWTLNKVKESVAKSEGSSEDTVFIHVSACKGIGNKLVATISQNQTNQLIELSEMAKICGIEDLDKILVVIHGLRRQGKAAIREGDTILVKVGESTITEVDLGIYSLRHNEQTLEKHLEELEMEKDAAVEEARTYINKNMKQAARSCLRKKHVLEKCMDKRLAALENVRLMLSRIHDAKSDAKILESYKIGLAALKNTLDGSDLTEESANNTMIQIEEVLDVHNEIQAAISKPMEENDEELEEELSALLGQPTALDQKLKELSVLSDLPEPPDSLPTIRPLKPKVPAMQPAL